jgi:acyl-CoA thioester hydrolase
MSLTHTRQAPAEFPFSLELRARFYETDAMGIVHHASYLAYLENARIEYLRAIGRPYGRVRAEGVDLAVVGVELAYRAPLRFDDVFVVHAGTAHVRRSSFAMEYLLVREGGEVVLSGFTRHAALDTATGRPVRVPAWISGE